jgi:hypothetical protein
MAVMSPLRVGRVIVQLESFDKLKKFNDLIGNRARDF